VNLERPARSAGIRLEEVHGDVPPPGDPPASAATADGPDFEPPDSGGGPSRDTDKAVRHSADSGKVPLHPAAVRFPLRVVGNMAAEFTGFEGFRWQEDELEELAALWASTPIQMSPTAQAMIATVAALGAKGTAFAAWRRMQSQAVKKEVSEHV